MKILRGKILRVRVLRVKVLRVTVLGTKILTMGVKTTNGVCEVLGKRRKKDGLRFYPALSLSSTLLSVRVLQNNPSSIDNNHLPCRKNVSI